MASIRGAIALDDRRFLYSAADLERLTKPCHRQARGMRLTSDGTNQKQRNQRGAVQEDCAIAARDDTFSQGRAATPERRASSQRHPLRTAHGHPLGRPPPRVGLWQRHNLLEATSRLASCRGVAWPASGTSGGTAQRRQARLQSRQHGRGQRAQPPGGRTRGPTPRTGASSAASATSSRTARASR